MTHKTIRKSGRMAAWSGTAGTLNFLAQMCYIMPVFLNLGASALSIHLILLCVLSALPTVYRNAGGRQKKVLDPLECTYRLTHRQLSFLPPRCLSTNVYWSEGRL